MIFVNWLFDAAINELFTIVGFTGAAIVWRSQLSKDKQSRNDAIEQRRNIRALEIVDLMNGATHLIEDAERTHRRVAELYESYIETLSQFPPAKATKLLARKTSSAVDVDKLVKIIGEVDILDGSHKKFNLCKIRFRGRSVDRRCGRLVNAVNRANVENGVAAHYLALALAATFSPASLPVLEKVSGLFLL